MAPNPEKEPNHLNIENYRPTPYREEVWPVVSEKREDSAFRPAQFERVSDGEFVVDSMFADFSKLPNEVIELDRQAGDFDLFPAEKELEYNTQPENDCSHASENQFAEPAENLTKPNNQAELEEIEPSENPLFNESLVTDEREEEISKSDDTGALNITEDKLEQALEQAYERGHADAVSQVQQIQRQLEERYSLLWEDMQTQLTEAASSYEMKSVELAMLVAKRLVGDVVETKREYIIEIIKEAMRAASDSKVVEIRVSPEDYEFLKLGSYGDKDKIISGESLNFTRDESIRSGCILTTSRGAIDLDLDKAWERIKDKILREPQP
jgi:flagellar assembly protein FliH